MRTLLVKYEERDLFMASHHREQLQHRLGTSSIELPQLFVDGQHIGWLNNGFKKKTIYTILVPNVIEK